MQKTEDINEIEEYGVPPINEFASDEESFVQRRGHSIVPLLQTACCALVLVALLVLKYQDTPKYDKAVAWFREAVVEEIELPKFQENPQTEKGESSESESAAQSGATSGAGQNAQRV